MSGLVLAFVLGLVAGVFVTIGWASAWAAGEAVVDRLLAPAFDAHADQAIANTIEPEVRS